MSCMTANVQTFWNTVHRFQSNHRKQIYNDECGHFVRRVLLWTKLIRSSVLTHSSSIMGESAHNSCEFVGWGRVLQAAVGWSKHGQEQQQQQRLETITRHRSSKVLVLNSLAALRLLKVNFLPLRSHNHEGVSVRQLSAEKHWLFIQSETANGCISLSEKRNKH